MIITLQIINYLNFYAFCSILKAVKNNLRDFSDYLRELSFSLLLTLSYVQFNVLIQ